MSRHSENLTKLIDRYASGGPLVAYAASGLTPEQETARPGPGAWSIAELVVHLVDSDLVAAERMKRVIAEDEPTLLNCDQDAWTTRLGAQEMPVEEAINLFVANRHWMTRVLRRCPEADFARAGNHDIKGRLTLTQLVSNYAGHVDHHLKFLYAKRANLGLSVYPRYSSNPEA